MSKEGEMQWSVVDGGPCPSCGCPADRLEYDVITRYDDNGDMASVHDVVDCPDCKRRLYEEHA